MPSPECMAEPEHVACPVPEPPNQSKSENIPSIVQGVIRGVFEPCGICRDRTVEWSGDGTAGACGVVTVTVRLLCDRIDWPHCVASTACALDALDSSSVNCRDGTRAKISVEDWSCHTGSGKRATAHGLFVSDWVHDKKQSQHTYFHQWRWQ